MSLQKVKFTEIETLEPVYGLVQKYAEVDYEIDGVELPLELTLTEYAGDKEHDQYFSIDIKQGQTWFGDEFASFEEALLDAEYRILELYDSYEIGSGNVNEKWEAV